MNSRVQNPVYIGEVVQNARVFNLRHWRTDASQISKMEPLLQTVADLFSLLRLRQIEYSLVGGIALLQYIEGRNTEDIDLIIAASVLQNLPEVDIVHQDDNFARGQFRGLQVDFLLTRNALFKHVQQNYVTTQHFIEQEISCATVEGLLLLKLYALPALYRMGNFARVGLYENDIATLLHDHRPDLAPLFEELAHHLSAADLAAVREVVRDIEGRIARFQQNNL
jgi:hypothetical protein